MNNAEYKYGCNLEERKQRIYNEEIVWHETIF
jgi:hypothetical protein